MIERLIEGLIAGLMGQRRSIGFPVLAIKFVDGDVQLHPIVEATPGHGVSILIGARDVETLDPACPAKAMLRAACIERVLGQIVCPAEQAKPRGWNDDVDVSAHRTDRAVAVFHLERAGQVHFKSNGLAVASPGMRRQLAHLPNPDRRTAMSPGCGAFQLTGELIELPLLSATRPEHHPDRQVLRRPVQGYRHRR